MNHCHSTTNRIIDNSSEKSANFDWYIRTLHTLHQPCTYQIIKAHVIQASSQHHTNDAHLFIRHEAMIQHEADEHHRRHTKLQSTECKCCIPPVQPVVRGNARSLSNPSHEIIFSNCQQIHNMKLGCSSKTWPLVKSVATFA